MIILNENVEIELPQNWAEYEDNSTNGVLSFINTLNDDSGVLQLSYAEYEFGKIPNPSKKILEKMAMNVCLNNNKDGKIKEHKSGICKFGLFGMASISSIEYKVFRIWYISNGKDFIMVSYINIESEYKEEIKQAHEIVINIKKNG